MPTYAFRCPDCAPTFEERRAFAQSDAPVTCPACGGGSAARRMGTPMVFSKGVAARALLEAPGRRPAVTAAHAGDCPCCSPRRPAATLAEARADAD